ncbi:hypothetical protein Back2_18110 [Nocardioides baekrokdamisoli]|uniref:Uncharacterized protein n=2 Tax=Nocardioides baekrokdamisoli TaxID=1804624 RepID=A0A3G9J247_9ACTN|nr:hypothetical protein Back2_18110 [Nocardioides baekrokdamisoli]
MRAVVTAAAATFGTMLALAGAAVWTAGGNLATHLGESAALAFFLTFVLALVAVALKYGDRE